jgi:formate dehydrogenase iron-sulfur subunit
MIRIFVPGDTAARSVGADSVAEAVAREAAARRIEIELVRNGSRGALWLEPLIEVSNPADAPGRLAYGPAHERDVPGVFEDIARDGMLGAAQPTSMHPRFLGRTDEIPWLASQLRLTFARVGVTDPLSAEEYEANGGLRGLRHALELEPSQIVDQVTASGLRGRGGAGFPTGIKWRTALDARSDVKFVCCNADEGDSGTFADRMLMEGDPFLLIEGMVIAGKAVGATEGYIYIRSEYPAAVAAMRTAVDIAYLNHWLGSGILGSDLCFDLSIRVGAGAYICGEETSMLESLEGNRGVARAKPPLPAIEGLFGKPTIVNNVLSLGAVPEILAGGAKRYQDLGTGRSRGTQVFQLGGNVRCGGIVEVPFGLSLRELVEGYGKGTASGRPIRAVQVGGPLGSYLPAAMLDLPLDYEAFAEAGAMVGHGGVVVFDDSVDMARQARFAMEFCAEESCGKCTPCRVGARRGVEVIDRITGGTGEERAANLVLLEDLCEVMVDGSLCAMGGLTPQPVRSALRYFPADFGLPDGAGGADAASSDGRGGTMVDSGRGDVE